jgi:hypothetical protein
MPVYLFGRVIKTLDSQRRKIGPGLWIVCRRCLQRGAGRGMRPNVPLCAPDPVTGGYNSAGKGAAGHFRIVFDRCLMYAPVQLSGALHPHQD